MLGVRAPEATKAARRILIGQIDDKNQETRLSAKFALMMLLMGDSVTKKLEEKIHVERKPVVAFDCAGSVTEKMEEKILDQLLILTSDPEKDIRILAIITLPIAAKRTATAEIVEHLLMLTDDPANSVRSAAIKALGEVGVGAITDVVLERLFTLAVDSEVQIRTTTAEALGNICQRESKSTIIQKLLALSADPEAEVRATAAWALGESNAEKPNAMVRERLFALINDADERVCCTAAFMLSKGASLPAEVESHLAEFWLNRKMTGEIYKFRGLNVQVCNLAYAQLQKLAELRE